MTMATRLPTKFAAKTIELVRETPSLDRKTRRAINKAYGKSNKQKLIDAAKSKPYDREGKR